jgi:hypothetical protein
MDIRELPAMLVTTGIATPEQAEHLTELLREAVSRGWPADADESRAPTAPSR